MEAREICPYCNSSRIVKNGTIPNLNEVKQNYLCQDCGKQHRNGNRRHKLDEKTVEIIIRMLAERVSIRAIARILKVGESTVKRYSKNAYQNTDTQNVRAEGIETDCRTNTCEAVLDEAWSFVGKKQIKKWIWIALDALTLQVLAVVIGARDARNAKKLIKRLPISWQRHATFYTDKLKSYNKAIPRRRHVVDDQPMQNLAENFFMRLRAHSSRLVRKTVSFSKMLFNHFASTFINVNALNKSYY
jgi:IS1 family transposase/transposase-like protein